MIPNHSTKDCAVRSTWYVARRTFMVAVAAAAISLAGAATVGVNGDFANKELTNVPIAALKTAYLLCGRSAMKGELNTSEIMQCSVVYEELKLRAFDGDFEKLRAWSKAQSDQMADDRR